MHHNTAGARATGTDDGTIRSRVQGSFLLLLLSLLLLLFLLMLLLLSLSLSLSLLNMEVLPVAGQRQIFVKLRMASTENQPANDRKNKIFAFERNERKLKGCDTILKRKATAFEVI